MCFGGNGTPAPEKESGGFELGREDRQILGEALEAMRRLVGLAGHGDHRLGALEDMLDLLSNLTCGHRLFFEQQEYDADRQARWPQPTKLPPPRRPMTYEDPVNHIFVISHDCTIGCTRMPHNDDCVVEHGNMVIESIYLDDQLARGPRCHGVSASITSSRNRTSWILISMLSTAGRQSSQPTELCFTA